MADNETPQFALISIRDVIEKAQEALTIEDCREVLFQLDLIRERCSWVEKMMWRRLNSEKQT